MGNIFSNRKKPEPIEESKVQPENVEESKIENKFDELKVELKVEEPKVVEEPETIESEDKPEPKPEMFINDFEDTNIIEVKSPNQHYEKVNIIDLVDIKQEYDVILPTVPGKTDSTGNVTNKKNSMFLKPPAPKLVKGKNVVFENLNLSVKDIKGRGQFVTILGKSGCGKCFTMDSIITIRNKKTQKIEKIKAEEMIKRLQHPN